MRFGIRAAGFDEVRGLRIGAWGLGSGVWGLGFGVQGLGCGVWVVGCRTQVAGRRFDEGEDHQRRPDRLCASVDFQTPSEAVAHLTVFQDTPVSGASPQG